MNDPRGSLWRRWDLHFHTPSSFDYENSSISDNQIVEFLLEANLAAVAITDHHVIDVRRIRNLQAIGSGRLTIFPGIEFRSDQGGDPIHYISIFPEDCDLEHVWTTLQGRLGLTFSVQDWLEAGDTWTFLEVNPQGQWLFLDAADSLVGESLAMHLARRSK